jgi:tetratricopeptide (TPR) repeat protein
MPLEFSQLDEDSGTYVYTDEKLQRVMDEFDDLLDTRRTGGISDEAYISGLQRLITEEPKLIDAHAHLAFIYLEQAKPKKALEAALAGLGLSNRLIPEGFAGKIEWGHLDNRPFLRALHGATLACIRLRRHIDAIALLEKALAYNPSDNPGLRFLLGSEYLRAGDTGKARQLLVREAQHYPPYFYELALSHILQDQWIPAATALRRGFCANGYIAEMLSGNPNPSPLPIWHGGNRAEPETATAYLDDYEALWNNNPEAKAFVRWLFNQPNVMMERAKVLECQEALRWEKDITTRTKLLNRQQQVETAIDDALSRQIVVQHEDRYKRLVYPWEVV